MKHITASLLTLFVLGLMIPSAFAEVPDWVKNTAGWWATDIISETEFVNAIEFLVNEEIIQVSDTTSGKDGSEPIPIWIKNNAGWWAEGQIDDETFVNGIEFLIKEGIIQIKTEQSELQILLQKRENLTDFIWKGDGFPTRFPDSIEHDISDKNFGNLKNLEKIDRITVEMKHGVNSVAYLLHPKEQSHDDLIIYHNGHDQYLHDGERQLRFLLDRGYPVLVFSMPLSGMNNEPVIILDGKETKLVNHDQFEILESDEFSAISYFVEPIAVSLNFIDKNFDYSNYHMIGISGGGWTAVIYPAIDERISHVFSVAGSVPLELRTNQRDLTDYENILPELYQIANYYDLYLLASLGEDKKLTQVFNTNDECCFAAERLDLSYSNEIKNRLTSLGSGEFEIITIRSGYHIVSGEALLKFYLDIDEKNVKYFRALEQRMQDKDFSGLDFTNIVLSQEDYITSFADTTGIDFTASRFTNVDFSNTILTNSNFFSSMSNFMDLTNTDVSNSDLSYSTICKPKIENTIIHNVDFTDSSIYNVDFTKSDLKNVKFNMSWCTYCIFDMFDISEIKIEKNLNQPTNFSGSSFKNVDFRNWEPGTVDFSAKIITGCTYESPILVPASDLTGSNFSGVDLENIVFTRGGENDIINLSNVDFSFADLSYHNLRHAKLVGANLSNSDLTGVDFTNADLFGANLTGANIKDAILDCHNHEICNK
uniref:Putative low-complexity protein n=1 Tax=uncultured marine thaumarchaeote KM3_181_G03 TaxID=1456065 RepID=A0A075GST8_9ARCH|nr:putative low-complexity protein [uncultured marine thaumarchaeote KM3_181_G03]